MAGSLDNPSMPPKPEVDAQNWDYDPCRIEELPVDSRTFFHHFYAPASKHPDNMWSDRLPWKLGTGLAPRDTGWGIHLEESPDWPLFAAFMFLCLTLSGLIAGIVILKTGDRQTGVSVGA